jgi:hypothetical protein
VVQVQRLVKVANCQESINQPRLNQKSCVIGATFLCAIFYVQLNWANHVESNF